MCSYENVIDTASVLDQLYQIYDQSRNESEAINQGFLKLDALLSELPVDLRNEAYLICNGIADEQARLAFREGIRMGIRLAKELPDI